MRDAVVCRVRPLHHCDEYRDVSATPSSEMPLMAAIGVSLGRGGEQSRRHILLHDGAATSWLTRAHRRHEHEIDQSNSPYRR